MTFQKQWKFSSGTCLPLVFLLAEVVSAVCVDTWPYEEYAHTSSSTSPSGLSMSPILLAIISQTTLAQTQPNSHIFYSSSIFHTILVFCFYLDYKLFKSWDLSYGFLHSWQHRGSQGWLLIDMSMVGLLRRVSPQR